jgi:hypothetical protein
MKVVMIVLALMLASCKNSNQQGWDHANQIETR